MIYLKNMTIKYNETIVNNGELVIPDCSITVISGKSGSGKTSILYRIGMISTAQDYEYYFDNERVNLSDKKFVSEMKQNLFGFLFQDGSLIESLTVAENLQLASQMAGNCLTEKEMIQLLGNVELTEKILNFYPPKLSGGERQRASLAMILAKRTKYIIADEPTASLDEENAKTIVNIFKKLRNSGYTIVVSTHSPELIGIADVVYRIENKRLMCVKKERNSESSGSSEGYQIKDNIKWSNIIWYAWNSKKKGKVLRALLTIFCSLAISGFAVTNNIMDYLLQTQEQLIHRISDREIYAVNQSTSTDQSVLDSDGNLMITDDMIQRISEMAGVECVYEMMEWRSFALNNHDICIENSIHVEADEERFSVLYSLENTERDYYVTLPYFQEQQYDKQLVVQYGNYEDGVYLSYDIAEELGLLEKSFNHVELIYNIGIPVYKLIDEIDAEENDLDIVEFCTVRVKVNGILDHNVTNAYTINGNSVIYMPYDVMKKTMSSFHSKDAYSDYNKEKLLEWRPSALVVYTESYKNVNTIKGKIENTTPYMVTRYAYQDTESLENLMKNLKEATNIILEIILCVIFILMCAIFISTTMNRKREYAILKSHGIEHHKLRGITLTESFIQSCKILTLSLACSSIVTVSMSFMLFGTYKMISIRMMMYIVIFSIMFVAVPSMASIFYINKLKVENIIRN